MTVDNIAITTTEILRTHSISRSPAWIKVRGKWYQSLYVFLLVCYRIVGYLMIYQLWMKWESYYIMVTENDRDRKFSYTAICRSLFIRQYEISNYLINWIHKKIHHINAMTNFKCRIVNISTISFVIYLKPQIYTKGNSQHSWAALVFIYFFNCLH